MKRFTSLPILLAALLSALIPLGQAHADQPGAKEQGCQTASVNCAPIGEWEVSLGVGLGAHTNPLIDGDDVPIVLLPDFSYYGKRFFLDDYQLGFTLLDTEHHAFNAIVTASYDQVYFQDWGLGNFTIENARFNALSNNPPVVVTPTPTGEPSDPDDAPVVTDSPTLSEREPDFSPDYSEQPSDPSSQAPDADIGAPAYDVDSRHMAGLAGFEYGYFNGPWSVGVLILQDFTGVHDGQEVRASVARGFHVGGNFFDVAAGVIWQSDDLLDYYYGVDEHEVSNNIGAYVAESEITPFIRTDWRRKLSKKWSFQATLHYKWLGREITDSPIVEDDAVGTVFIGGVYHF